jgi:DNA repair exonuclease SbcCD nuclease subunit
MQQFIVNGQVLILTDTHFGARTDSLVFHSYFMRFCEDVLFPYIKKHDIKYLLHLGDFTDRRKYINFYTLNKVRKDFMDRLKELGVTLVITLGNHDTYFKNTNEVNSLRELFSDSPWVIIFEEPTEVMFDNKKVLLLPWINETNYEATMKAIQETDAKYALGHLELKGFMMQRGLKSENGLSKDLFEKFTFVCSGHYHHKSSEGNIHYLGNTWELTFADINDPRGMHVWDLKTDVLEFIQNPHKMFHRIYYDDKDKTLNQVLKKASDKLSGTHIKVVVQNRTNPYYFEQFMERLFSISPADVRIEEMMNVQEDAGEDIVDMAEDTLTILNKYVDGLEIDTDKGKLKEEIRLLYTEASAMER